MYLYLHALVSRGVLHTGVIGSDVRWLECPACNALTWVINGHGINLYVVSMTLIGN